MVEEDDVELQLLIPMEMEGSKATSIRWQCFNYNSQGITMIIMASKRVQDKEVDLRELWR